MIGQFDSSCRMLSPTDNVHEHSSAVSKEPAEGTWNRSE